MLRLFVRELNGLVNEIGKTDPAFVSTAERLGELQVSGEVMFGFAERIEELSDPIDAKQISGTDLVEAAQAGYRFLRRPGEGMFVLTTLDHQPVLYIRSGSEEVDAMLRALRLTQDGRPFYALERATFTQAPEMAGDIITVRTRSILLALLYLVQGVQVPEADLEQSYTLRDWPAPAGTNEDIEDLFQVRFSRQKPDATLAVQYRDNWFYIEESDSASRITYLHLAEIIRLQFAEPGDAGPVLTLPVGGP